MNVGFPRIASFLREPVCRSSRIFHVMEPQRKSRVHFVLGPKWPMVILSWGHLSLRPPCPRPWATLSLPPSSLRSDCSKLIFFKCCPWRHKIHSFPTQTYFLLLFSFGVGGEIRLGCLDYLLTYLVCQLIYLHKLPTHLPTCLPKLIMYLLKLPTYLLAHISCLLPYLFTYPHIFYLHAYLCSR
jgi:hypothetical protein